jgi:hypothetical protein
MRVSLLFEQNCGEKGLKLTRAEVNVLMITPFVP